MAGKEAAEGSRRRTAPEAPRMGEPEKDGSCGFECNICLDVAKEPVLTSCGHLFCWPCLYRWLIASRFPECPVCKSVVLEQDITPIYGRGRQEEGDSTANLDLPPRPPAKRRESLSRQLQMAGLTFTTEVVSEMIQMMQGHPGIVGSLPTPAGTEMTSLNAAQVVLAAPPPQQSSSVQQLSTSSTAAAIVGEPGTTRRSRRPSESPTIRRTTRRRPQ